MKEKKKKGVSKYFYCVKILTYVIIIYIGLIFHIFEQYIVLKLWQNYINIHFGINIT